MPMRPHCIVAFAGHMIDQCNRAMPRFPSYAEPAVRTRIGAVIRRLSPAAVVSSAACGGDIIFAEEALKLDTRLYVILPFENQHDFLEHSVEYAGNQWVDRFAHVCDHATPAPLFVKSGGYTGDHNFEDNQRALIFFAMGVAAAQNLPLKSLILCDEAQLGTQIGGTRSFLELCHDLRIPYEIIDVARLR